MIRSMLMLAAAASLLTACGRRADLVYPVGTAGPATPRGSSAPPTAAKLTEPTTEARPARDDEVLRQSEEREPDPFDLPPERR